MVANGIHKVTFIKTKAHCADGIIRTVYSQLSILQYEKSPTMYAGYVKIGLMSVSGRVYLTENPTANANGQLLCANYFEANQDGANASLLPSWVDIQKAFEDA